MPVFDENGDEIPGAVAEVIEPGNPRGQQADEEPEGEVEEETDTEGAGDGDPAPAGKKYKIGDQEFDTIEEAHAFASAAVSQTVENDAYRQIVNDMIRAPAGGETVTPPAAQGGVSVDEEKLWANPTEFLKEFATQIKQQTRAELDQAAMIKQTGDRVWGEFTQRHPALADFRSEVEQYVEKNQAVVQKLVKAKGVAAGYDFIAMNLRDQFARYAEATKPQKVLPNGGTQGAPAANGKRVTQKQVTKKPLSFAEQIRSIKKGKR